MVRRGNGTTTWQRASGCVSVPSGAYFSLGRTMGRTMMVLKGISNLKLFIPLKTTIVLPIVLPSVESGKSYWRPHGMQSSKNVCFLPIQTRQSLSACSSGAASHSGILTTFSRGNADRACAYRDTNSPVRQC